MDNAEAAAGAQRQSDERTDAVCWECGENTPCYEYVVCCTGTLFHLCPACEERIQNGDDAE